LRNADANTDRLAKCDTNRYRFCYRYTYSTAFGYAFRVGVGFSYTHCIAELLTGLHIHIRDRNHRAGSHRHREPLR
jgi:hypothetical protein